MALKSDWRNRESDGSGIVENSGVKRRSKRVSGCVTRLETVTVQGQVTVLEMVCKAKVSRRRRKRVRSLMTWIRGFGLVIRLLLFWSSTVSFRERFDKHSGYLKVFAGSVSL